ncbi:MAG TPA: hypothetical protein VF613_14240 [Longimicrobium sp.]
MSIYSQQCTFTSTTPLQDATNGWDAVYAVTYDTINADLAQRKPWLQDFRGESPGTFTIADAGGNQLQSATITSLTVSPGGSGKLVQFNLAVSAANLIVPGGSPVSLVNLVGTIQTTLTFVADPAVPGLHNLQVDNATPFTVVSVTGVATTPSSRPITSFEASMIGGILEALCTAYPATFTGVYANVFTRDYAESVDIPWLQPAAFDYAVAPAGPDSGILAVLASVSGDVAGLTPQVTSLLFPTNAGVNAAVAISSTTLANQTFLQNLNGELGTSELGAFAADSTGQTLSNAAAISAYYRVDATTGAVSLVPPAALADSAGATYPVAIAAGAVTISFTDNAIAAAVTGAVVDLGDGYTLTISMSSAYQLVVDPDQSIDLVLSGSPAVTSSLTAPDTSSAASVLEGIGITALGLLAGEAIPLMLDAATGWFTDVGTTTSSLSPTVLKFFAAERQMRTAERPVTFSIGGGRNVIISRPGDPETAPVALTQDSIDAVTLNPVYPGDPAGIDLPPASPTDPEQPASHGNLNSSHSSGSEAGQLPSIATQVYERVWSSVRGSATAVRALQASCRAAGFTADADYFPQGNGAGAAPPANLPELPTEQRAALYTGCIRYVIRATESGQMTGSLYGELAESVPGTTVGPRAIGDPVAGAVGGIRITTSTSGDVTAGVPGLFQDLRAASESGNAGLSRFVIQEIIRSTPRPLWIKVLGAAIYSAGLVAGVFVDQALGDWQSQAAGPPKNPGKGAAQIAGGGTGGPSNLLFSSVSFPFMERFQSGAASGPVPENTLRCASVNGGLILGVQIALDLS